MDRHHSIPPMHPGELIREDLLPALGISKVELAQSLGISRQTVYDILNERQTVYDILNERQTVWQRRSLLDKPAANL